MKSYLPSISIVLLISISACSDAAQFSQATQANVIQAERIVNSDLPTSDPSADATAPGGSSDPAMGSTSDGGNAVAGDGTNSTTGSSNNPGSIGVAPGGSGGTVASNTGGNVATTPEAIADKVAQLKATCDGSVKKTLKQSIHFAEIQHCSWNANGNLGRLDMHVQAIEGQKATIELPVDAQLCELGIGSAATTIQYDDFMLLTLNNQVLLTSNKELLVGLQEEQALAYAWDFSKIRGKAIDFNAAPYCLGDASLCKIPVTDVKGAFQFSIDPSSLGKLAANSTNKKNLEFALYATGDNDDRDCWHTAFTLDFTLNYVE